MAEQSLSRSTRCLASAGFTLIELLVVISIIALLIGILLPALGAARKSAMSLQCLTQQRQFGMGLSMFAEDHKDYLPKAWFNDGPGRLGLDSSTDWGYREPNWGWDFILWDGYLNRNTQVFRDPADEETTVRLEGVPTAEEEIPASYRYNISDLPDEYHAIRVDELTAPTESIRIFDGAPGPGNNQWHHVATWEGDLRGLVGPTRKDNNALNRHPGSANYTFADGHAASASWEDTWKNLMTSAEAKGQKTMWRQVFEGKPDRF